MSDNSLPVDYLSSDEYAQRVYAGVLGKCIGVYLGRPFEGWDNARIERELGEIHGYVHEKLHRPLVVADDDLSGTFTFVRALEENGFPPEITAAQIGDWWRNVLIEGKTILWWGGLGVSTEHTAFLRLKAGLKAPESGSVAANGRLVAEQIGAQIFCDGWGLICPGDPARAAELARRGAAVSHDGEALYGAQVIAAMEAAAFAGPSLDVLLDTGLEHVPTDCLIARLIGDVRGWAAAHEGDWRATFAKIAENYGYDKYGGGCHMVPNHAVIWLALCHGGGDFGRSLTIANTAGWDTDCNSGNVGCLLGVLHGLAGLEENQTTDWRGPVADRMILPTADSARCVTDAVRETYALVNTARALAGQPPLAPKDGARFHFSLPGSVQGFEAEPDAGGTLTVGHTDGALALHLAGCTAGRAATPTFLPSTAPDAGGYDVVCSPTLYPGQIVTAQMSAQSLDGPVAAGLYVQACDGAGGLTMHRGSAQTLAPGAAAALTFTVPDTGGQPVAEVGVEVLSESPRTGVVRLESLTWDGTPTVTLGRAAGEEWKRAWAVGTSQFEPSWGPGQAFRVIQNAGTGLVTQGEWEWTGYTVSARVMPHLSRRVGLCGAVRGLRRYVALVLDDDGGVRLVEQRDGVRRVLAESDAVWAWEQPAELSLTVSASGLSARFNDTLLTAAGGGLPTRGAVGLLVQDGCADWGPVRVE